MKDNASGQPPTAGTQQTQRKDQEDQAIAEIREQWGAVIRATVAAGLGNLDAANSVAPFFDQMEQKAEWRALIGILRRILAGERDALALLRGLDATDTLVAGDILRGLGVDVPVAGQAESANDDGKMVSLEQFIQQVVRACKPDAPAGIVEQMLAATRGMALQPNLAPELRELGRVLNQILTGEHDPDLRALHPQLAERVRRVLMELS